ncbi:hypothetical protein CSIM01_09321 [Colletotrichum simmondsii]|uniref:Uncharacterized protein n=1 Tax=Colletotrichum simmondsii TaxID=703756 RepID=A0A135TFT9_9PEZI|nr:hypothetical protein CSIM01_09321 [Colletotrichum simmondsii]
MINSCLPLEARATDNPVRQLEEKNPLMRHAWLNLNHKDHKVEYMRAAVKIFEALSLGDGPSFKDLVSSDSLCSTLWARPELRFCFDPISPDSASLSHNNYDGGTFIFIQLSASVPSNFGTLIDQELDRPTATGSHDWFGDPGYTWFLLYWKTNPEYRVKGPSAERADSRIEENSEGTQNEYRHIDDSTKRDEHESILPIKNSTSLAVREQSSSNHGHQIFSLRRPLWGWAPPKQTPDPVTHKLMTGNDFLQRDERNFNVICGHCSALGHALIDCIWPGPFGDIDGCPICNTTEHRFDNCQVFEVTHYDFTLLDLLHHILVVRRANKPPILTRLVWTHIARAYVKDHEGNYMQNPVGYPWTKSFAMEIWKNTFKDANKQFWLTYDYSKDSSNQSRLQVDLVTKDWQTALQNEELILEDQKQHGWNAVKYLHY